MIPSSLRRFRRSVVRRRYLGAVAVLFLLSVAYLLLTRLSTPFSAQVETTSISFSVGDWRGSGGIFQFRRVSRDIDDAGPLRDNR